MYVDLIHFSDHHTLSIKIQLVLDINLLSLYDVAMGEEIVKDESLFQNFLILQQLCYKNIKDRCAQIFSGTSLSKFKRINLNKFKKIGALFS